MDEDDLDLDYLEGIHSGLTFMKFGRARPRNAPVHPGTLPPAAEPVLPTAPGVVDWRKGDGAPEPKGADGFWQT